MYLFMYFDIPSFFFLFRRVTWEKLAQLGLQFSLSRMQLSEKGEWMWEAELNPA